MAQQRNRLRVVVARKGLIAAHHYAVEAVVVERPTRTYVHVRRVEPKPTSPPPPPRKR